MSVDEILAILNGYSLEMGAILGRFTKSKEGIYIDSQDNYRLRTIVTELLDLVKDHVPASGQHQKLITDSYNNGVSNFTGSSSYASVKEIQGVVSALITKIERSQFLVSGLVGKVSVADSSKRLFDRLEQTILRFHAVAVQLRDRYNSRPTLDVNDEYDVQDLMHALLRLNFEDVRPEEWVPSYAGSASRTDFLLPQINTVIEIKKTRAGLNAKAVGEQLIIDIAKYKKHPQCRHLFCFVYDPEGRIANPVGIENDLNGSDNGIEVRVLILPKAS